MIQLASIREQMRMLHRADEQSVLDSLLAIYNPDTAIQHEVSAKAAALVTQVRDHGNHGLMEVFLAEYGLSTDEGVALMCLAEALLRVPDNETIDELIEDKIAPSEWGEHLGQSSSSLVNASTWALLFTGKVLQEAESSGVASVLKNAIKRLGEPVIRTAVKRAMQEMGHTFVLGESIEEATKRAKEQEQLGFTYSYDMLGEAAMTADDATAFFDSYRHAIETLSSQAEHDNTQDNPGISIKLSALHPRYEVSQKERVMQELVPRVKHLALLAKQANMGLNIDAEEANRLELSLDVIEAVLRSDELSGWDGFGVVVQAYGKRALAVIDWLYALAQETDRKLMVRLVKGAYWDSEIKQAQVDGVPDFPVFTKKAATDVSYICCARKLLDCSDRIYPQFATHNAHSVCAILSMTTDQHKYEFQRLHGMGEVMHQCVMEEHGTRCRIYAPVGTHRDLLAYLVRRLLENGANSSFLNQVVDESISPDAITQDPFTLINRPNDPTQQLIIKPTDLYQPNRENSAGWDLDFHDDWHRFQQQRDKFQHQEWNIQPILVKGCECEDFFDITNPNQPDERVGSVSLATAAQVEVALQHAAMWSDVSGIERSQILDKAAQLYEANAGELFAVLAREAGKTPADAIAEIREAVDFLRYYATEGVTHDPLAARGVITCISPWNFPLAIFTGQIAAALAAGNAVLAKPAEPTPIIAAIGTRLLHEAGVPTSALQLLPGDGPTVGQALTTDPRVNGIAFTGSTQVAQTIYRNSALTLEPDAMFIAETGGLNAMIVDSSALAEQAVNDVVDSAFRSCGQRCSALRMLYIQTDVAEAFMDMLFGAMDELTVCDSWQLSCDVGPIINEAARRNIVNYIDAAIAERRLLKQITAPTVGHFVGPAVVQVEGIGCLEKEVFGPVLHVATFEAHEIDNIVHAINASEFGLTFGLHTRIDDRVQQITSQLNVGNLYVNRNQIGAVVGTQPFGGEGLSGTGPKAGGPHYVKRFKSNALPEHLAELANEINQKTAQALLTAAVTNTHQTLASCDMPGPTGESNRWSCYPRGTILCLGPSAQDAQEQMRQAKAIGCQVVGVAPGLSGEGTADGCLSAQALTHLQGYSAVVSWGSKASLREYRQALANRAGALLPLITAQEIADFCVIERHLCIDTTAAGGNAQLLAGE